MRNNEKGVAWCGKNTAQSEIRSWLYYHYSQKNVKIWFNVTVRGEHSNKGKKKTYVLKQLFKPLQCSNVRWLHFEVFSTIQV